MPRYVKKNIPRGRKRDAAPQEDLDFIKTFFETNKHFNQHKLCRQLKIPVAALYRICKTEKQSVSKKHVEVLLRFINNPLLKETQNIGIDNIISISKSNNEIKVSIE